jgi:hypothetical protein
MIVHGPEFAAQTFEGQHFATGTSNTSNSAPENPPPPQILKTYFPMPQAPIHYSILCKKIARIQKRGQTPT